MARKKLITAAKAALETLARGSAFNKQFSTLGKIARKTRVGKIVKKGKKFLKEHPNLLRDTGRVIDRATDAAIKYGTIGAAAGGLSANPALLAAGQGVAAAGVLGKAGKAAVEGAYHTAKNLKFR